MDFLPQVSPENLNEGDLERGDLAVHEYSRQVKLYLKTDIHLKEKTQLFFLFRDHCILIAMLESLVLTLALFMVGDHQSVNRRLGIWLRPDLWALVSFFHFIDSSKPLAFSLKAINTGLKRTFNTVKRFCSCFIDN